MAHGWFETLQSRPVVQKELAVGRELSARINVTSDVFRKIIFGQTAQ